MKTYLHVGLLPQQRGECGHPLRDADSAVRVDIRANEIRHFHHIRIDFGPEVSNGILGVVHPQMLLPFPWGYKLNCRALTRLGLG